MGQFVHEMSCTFLKVSLGFEWGHIKALVKHLEIRAEKEMVGNGVWKDVNYRFAGLPVRQESLPTVEEGYQQV